jgi:hypothetical protein
MPFFDLLGTRGVNRLTSMTANETDVARPGEVSILISNSTFEGIELSEKLRFFTTQDLNFRGIILTISDSIFRNNVLEKGYMFEFNHNFRLVIFARNNIQSNIAYFLEMTPSDTK